MSNRDRNSARPTAGCSISRGWLSIGWLSVCIALTSGSAAAEDSYGGRLWQYEGDRFVQYATGTNLMMEAIDPSLRKWYLPQEVAAERTYQWEYTNYARTRYRRYQDANLEGDYFYDQFGRFLSKGWVVYDWRQVQPASSEGSRVIKSSQYSAWFSKLVLSSDSKGQHHFSVMVGDEIRTQLPPMTFRKTAFNGVQFDYTNDHLAATVLMSRINLPVLGGGDGRPAFADSYTNLIGFRTVYNLGDAVKIGGTFVNSHHGRIANERFEGNPFNGNLTTGQLSERINQILVRITETRPATAGAPSSSPATLSSPPGWATATPPSSAARSASARSSAAALNAAVSASPRAAAPMARFCSTTASPIPKCNHSRTSFRTPPWWTTSAACASGCS